MLNVLIPIVERGEQYNKLLANLNGNSDVLVFVGVRKNELDKLVLAESENIFIFEYDNSSKREEILNSLSENIQVGEVMVLRKPISIDEFFKFWQNNSNIVVCKKKRSKAGEFFHKIWQKILKTFLGIKLYEGDTSVIKFNEDIGAVLSQTHDFSFATRADRWKGLTTDVVEVKSPPVNPEIDKSAIMKCSLFMALALVIAVVATSCVCVLTKVSILGGLLLFCLDTICFSVMLIMAVMIGFNCEVGKKYNNRANLA